MFWIKAKGTDRAKDHSPPLPSTLSDPKAIGFFFVTDISNYSPVMSYFQSVLEQMTPNV